MAYGANDLITSKITAGDAARLNDGKYAQIFPEQIIKHEPAPGPFVYWRCWDGIVRDESLDKIKPIEFEWDHIEKLTLNPDGTYTVEVVK